MIPKGARRIKVIKDGPYVVSGNIPLAEEHIVYGHDGEPAQWARGPSFPDQETYALCRCGASKNKPFCDGSHVDAAFDGTETAGHGHYLENVEKTIGPCLDLTWSEDLHRRALLPWREGRLELHRGVRRRPGPREGRRRSLRLPIRKPRRLGQTDRGGYRTHR